MIRRIYSMNRHVCPLCRHIIHYDPLSKWWCCDQCDETFGRDEIKRWMDEWLPTE